MFVSRIFSPKREFSRFNIYSQFKIFQTLSLSFRWWYSPVYGCCYTLQPNRNLSTMSTSDDPASATPIPHPPLPSAYLPLTQWIRRKPHRNPPSPTSRRRKPRLQQHAISISSANRFCHPHSPLPLKLLLSPHLLLTTIEAWRSAQQQPATTSTDPAPTSATTVQFCCLL